MLSGRQHDSVYSPRSVPAAYKTTADPPPFFLLPTLEAVYDRSSGQRPNPKNREIEIY